MNALPNSFLQTSSTVTPQRITNIGAFNKLVDAVSNLDLYESDDEPKPRLALVHRAADILSSVSLENAEVAPSYGEINVTWKANGVRVKATFGPDPDLFYVYREGFENGRVVYSHMEENASPAYLKASLQWLASPFANV